MVNIVEAVTPETTSEDIRPNLYVGVLTALDYLCRKESLLTFDPQEELIFFPEVSKFYTA